MNSNPFHVNENAHRQSENTYPSNHVKSIGLLHKHVKVPGERPVLGEKQPFGERPFLGEKLPLQQQSNKQRNYLSDKNNNIRGGLVSQKPQSTFKLKESQPFTKVYVDNQNHYSSSNTSSTRTRESKANTQEQQVVDEFYQDNKERYPVSANEPLQEDTMAPFPILPIIVPQHLKHRFKKNSLSSKIVTAAATAAAHHSSLKRYSENNFPSLQEKKQKTTSIVTTYKTTNSYEQLFSPDTPSLDFPIRQETISFEREQESRAKMAMLQTTQMLKEHQWNDPMIVAEYASEIFGHLYDSELVMMADPGYASKQQHEVTWKMRSVLIDWVIEIHYLFQLLPETLFLAVNIIDRFLSLRTVVLGKLQLVGITSLFIATKFEEMSCPTMRDFLFMTDEAVKEDELIKAERFILQVLDFRLCYPNPFNFLRRVCTEEMHCDIHTRTLAKYLMEIACIDHTFINVRPSKIAASALWLSKKMLAKGKWNSSFTKLSGYPPDDLKSTVEAMLNYLSQPVAHDAFFKKWSSKKLSKASIFVRDWINRYYIN